MSDAIRVLLFMTSASPGSQEHWSRGISETPDRRLMTDD